MARPQFSIRSLLWLMLWISLALGSVVLVNPPQEQVLALLRWLATPRGIGTVFLLACIASIPFLQRHW